MQLFRILAGVAMAGIVAGCSYPVESSRTLETNATVSFVAPADQSEIVIEVDGTRVGTAADYAAGERALRVAPGTRTITAVLKDGRRYQQRIFVGSGVHKNVRVP